tara:strand:+ start:102 stop:314 length:213 start_codon:yes stop_codon:yes gene_type:complete
MYTKEDYLNEKNSMSKQERMIQERFERLIDILILYKQSNPGKDIYLSEKHINEAICWFQNNLSSLVDGFN